MYSHRNLILNAFIIGLLAFSGLIAAPVRVHADDDEATKIYKLARDLHYENTDQGGFTIWVNGDIGENAALRLSDINGGDAIPAFKLNVFDGKDTLSSDDLKGPYFLNFWASWCPPCRKEFPLFVKNISSKDFSVPVIFVDGQDSKADARTFLISLDLDSSLKLIIVVDQHSSLYLKLGFKVVPDTVLVDADGKVQAIQIGEMSETALKFFSEIATHPGIGSFDRLHPEDQPAAPAATEPEGTPDPQSMH